MGRLVIGGHGLVDLVGLRINIGKVVVVCSQFLVVVGILLCRLRGAAQLQCLFVIGYGQLVAFLFFGGIGLLGRRQSVGVAELEPDQIARVVDLVGFIEGGDGGIEVAGIGSRLGGIKLLIQRADGTFFLLGFGGSLLRFRDLFRRQSLPLGHARLLLLQVEVQRCFVQPYRDTIEVKEFLAVLAELDVVLAGGDAEREILAFIVGFESVLVAGFGPSPLHLGLHDRFPIKVFARSLHGARRLRQRERSAQPHREYEQGKDEIFPHDLASRH